MMRTVLSDLFPGLLGATLALSTVGCNKAQQSAGVMVAGVACEGIAIASSHPELAPICATAEEFAAAWLALYGAKSLTPSTAGPGAVPFDRDAIRGEILRRRAVSK